MLLSNLPHPFNVGPKVVDGLKSYVFEVHPAPNDDDSHVADHRFRRETVAAREHLKRYLVRTNPGRFHASLRLRWIGLKSLKQIGFMRWPPLALAPHNQMPE